MRRHLTQVFDVSSATQKNSEHRGTARANFGIEQWRISAGSAVAYAFATLCVSTTMIFTAMRGATICTFFIFAR
jgi:hypothetical protein